MKKIYYILIISLIPIFITSCKGTKVEIENLCIAVALGYDITPDGKYTLTAQILNPQKESSGSSMKKKGTGKQTAANVVIFTSSADSISACRGQLSTKLGKEINYGHTKFVVVGKQLAESGMAPIVDATLRSFKMKSDIPLLVTKGNAFDIINTISAHEKIPANEVDNILKLQSNYGYDTRTTILDFFNCLTSDSQSPTTGVISLGKSIDTDETFEMSGTAVFKKDKLIGFMDMNETRGMNWITGKIKRGYITAALEKEDKITFDIIKADSKIKPKIVNDSIIMNVNVKNEVNIAEMTGSIDPMKTPEIMKDLEKKESDVISKEIQSALYAAQKKIKLDIFGFGEVVHRDNPKQWKLVQGNWKNIFPELDVQVTVKSILRRIGRISKPAE